MKRWRQHLVSVFVASFVASHACVLITAHQHWPILSYRMFSFNLEHGLSCPVAFGVPADGSRPEFAINSQYPDWDSVMVSFGFKKILNYPERTRRYQELAADCPATEETRSCVAAKLIANGLAYLVSQYDSLREADPTMPALRGMRIYDVDYRGSFDGFTITSKRLRGEWMRPAK